MKVSMEIAKYNYRFVADFENGHEPYVIAHDNYLYLATAQHVIDVAFRSPYRSFLNENICKELDSAYQDFLKKAYALNGQKYRKKKVEYRFISFNEMQSNLRNKINQFQKDNGFSDWNSNDPK